MDDLNFDDLDELNDSVDPKDPHPCITYLHRRLMNYRSPASTPLLAEQAVVPACYRTRFLH